MRVSPYQGMSWSEVVEHAEAQCADLPMDQRGHYVANVLAQEIQYLCKTVDALGLLYAQVKDTNDVLNRRAA